MITVDWEDRMNKTFRWLAMLALAAAMQAGVAGLALAQGTMGAGAANTPGGAAGGEPTANASGPAQGYGVGGPDQTTAAGPSETEPATELPVLYVTSVEILRTQTDPKLDIVRVTGLTGSQGWTSPQLVPTFVGKPLDGILDLQFIATMPLQTQPAEGFVQVGTVFTMEEGQTFKGVRVRASENSIEVDQIPGSKQEAVKVDGCKDCVGKKFIEKGQGSSADQGSSGNQVSSGQQQGVVRQEDLPKVLRWIPPNHGIRGITHNPNRLNLMLGADNTIIAAYWE